nr:hypothetical protein [Kiritimatiellia bacterium]
AFQRPREASQTNACITNLRVIECAMDQYAIEQNLATGQGVTLPDLVGAGNFIDETPTCPASGTYGVATIGTEPTCTIGGHEL